MWKRALSFQKRGRKAARLYSEKATEARAQRSSSEKVTEARAQRSGASA